jgi:hypothetical protein
LHIAFWAKEAKICKLILNFMTVLDRKNEVIFKDILPMIIEWDGFSDYFESLGR